MGRSVCGFAWCSLALAGWACSAQPSEDSSRVTADRAVKLNVCDSAASGTQVVTAYALEKGIFAKHGLDVTLIPINSGSRAVAALIAGSVQICTLAGSAVAHAVVAGADVTIVGSLVERYLYSLVVSSGIRSASDLKGRAVAVSASGSASEMAVRLAIRTLGLQPGRDVAILAIGGQPERLAALEAGYVAGTLLSYPGTSLARQKGLHVLMDMSTLDLPYVHTGTATTRSFLAGNRKTVLSFMKATTEAVFEIKKDRDGTIAVLSKETQLDREQDADALAETYEVMYQRGLVDVPFPSLRGIDALLAEIAQQNPAAAGMRAEAVADSSIVREIEASGFLDELRGPP